MSGLDQVLFAKVPPLFRSMVAPHIEEIKQSDLYRAVDGLVSTLAAQKEMEVSEFVTSGEATRAITALIGMDPPSDDLDVQMCPKCKHVRYGV